MLQHVLLCVTTAETVHLIKDRLHEVDGTAMLTAAMRQHGLRYGYCYRSNDTRDGSLTKTKHAHRIEHSTGRTVAPGRGQRHHPMRLSERGEAITDSLLCLVGNLDPAVAHIDALTLKSKQHGCGILHIDIEIGLCLRERRSRVTKSSIIEVKNRLEFPLLKVKHRTVPPEVMDQVAATRKVTLVLFEQIYAVALMALHLHNVSQSVYAPEVSRVNLQGNPPDGSAAA